MKAKEPIEQQSSSSKVRITNVLSQDLEKAWLFWKVEERSKTKQIVEYYLEQNSVNRDIVYLACLVYSDESNWNKTLECVDKLETLQEPDKETRLLKARAFIGQNRWKEAGDVLETIIETSEEEMDVLREYAFVLSQARQWKDAAEIYERLIDDPSQRTKDLVWEYHRIVENASSAIHLDYHYQHAPDSLRQHIMEQKFQWWFNDSDKLRMQVSAYEELYQQPARGGNQSFRDWIKGTRIYFDYNIKTDWNVAGNWTFGRLDGEDFHEFNLETNYQYKKWSTALRIDYNALIKSPTKGIQVKAREDKVEWQNLFTITDRLSIGHVSSVSWYRVDSKENTVNYKKNLGHKCIEDGFINFALIPEWGFYINAHYLWSYWHKTFETANTFLDFIDFEKILYGGFYHEVRLTEQLNLITSFTRSYDRERRYYTTLSSVGLTYWIKDNIKAEVSYDYSHDANGTAGSGNSQNMYFKFHWYF